MTAEFDAHADSYLDQVDRAISFTNTEHAFFVRRKHDALIDLTDRLVGAPSACSVLDLGCGIGNSDTALVEDFAHVAGVDTSGQAIAIATQRNPQVDYQAYDGSTLPYADASFDVAFSICVMHHVEPADRAAFVREMTRVVRPGGVAVVFEHNPLNPLTRITVSRCEFDEGVVLLRKREVEQRFRSAGLIPIEARYIIFTTSDRPTFARLERSLASVPLGAQYYVAARRT